MGRWKFENKSYLLIFDDFGKKVDFLSKFGLDLICGFIKFWETDKHTKKYHNPIPANSAHYMLFEKFQKNLRFSVFLGKFGNFFFQNEILGKIGPRTITNWFSDIF